jgi:hypothetical protein
VIINELQSRGQIFRTDTNDAECATNPAKVGPDQDGQAGGCDNIRVTISDAGVQANIWHGNEP